MEFTLEQLNQTTPVTPKIVAAPPKPQVQTAIAFDGFGKRVETNSTQVITKTNVTQVTKNGLTITSKIHTEDDSSFLA